MCVACEDADRCFIMQIAESCDRLSVISMKVVVVAAAAAITFVFCFPFPRILQVRTFEDC